MKKSVGHLQGKLHFSSKDVIKIARLEELLQKILREIPPHQVEGLDLDAAYMADLELGPVDQFAGLEGFNALQDLCLAGHDIHSWQGLPNLPLLRNLDMGSNQLCDFLHAPDLPALQSLDLSLNLLQNLNDMPVWPQLRILNLGHNELRSLAGLEGRAIRSLTISGNRALQDLSVLQELPHLRVCLAKNLFVSDWSWVAAASLEELAFRPTASQRVAVLSDCASLQHLSLDLSRCEGSCEILPLPILRELILSKGSKLSNIQIGACPRLRFLSITFGGLKALPELACTERLEVLDLRFNELTHLPDLAQFPALKSVFLEGNPLSSDIRRQLTARPDISWVL